MTPERVVPLNQPSIGDLEKKYVQQALDSSWTTIGPFVHRFEADFAGRLGREHAVACSSGSAALLLALRGLGLGAGDRVLTQAYTCDAVANAVIAVTALPPAVVDVDAGTWGLRAAEVGEALAAGRYAAVILAHTYGVPARDTEAIAALCRRHGVPLIEDASEAHGATLAEQRCGTFGDVGVFSLRGEKTLGAGQFGVVVTDDRAVARRAHQWAHNGLPADQVRYWSTVPGLNFQPSNLNAALACAQLDRLDELVAARNDVHRRWVELLGPWVGRGLEFQAPHGTPAWWLTGILLLPDFTPMLPQDLGVALGQRGIQTRPGFYPLHRLPHVGPTNLTPCDFSERLLRQLLILPSGPGLTAEDQAYVVQHLLEVTGRG